MTPPTRFLLALAGVALFALPFPHPAGAETLRVGLVPELNIFVQARRYEPVAAYVEEATGVKMKFVSFADYGQVLAELGAGEIDGAFVGSYIGAAAIEAGVAEPIARPMWPGNVSRYRGLIVVRRDSQIRTVADMRGKVLALVSRMTTAGYLFPVAYLQRAGVADFSTYFRQHYFAGSHDAAIRAVLDGRADVGGVKDTVFERLGRAEPRVEAELTILARSVAVPSNGLVLGTAVDASAKRRLQRALLEMDEDGTGRTALQEFGALEFIETTREDYAPVLEMGKRTNTELLTDPSEER